MAIRIPYGIDPDEVWDLDFCAEMARGRARIELEVAKSLRASAATERNPEAHAALLMAAERAERNAKEAGDDLAGYTPGSGPSFRVGAIPGVRRAELVGRHQEVSAMAEGREKAMASVEWARDVVSAAVKGHANLKTSSGREVPFDSEGGRPSAKTLEAYSQILTDLAWAILGQQRLGPDGKNA